MICILSAVKSFLELVRYIFTIPGVKFFLSERISQDPLENFFGCQRQRGGASENPNVQEFCKNTQALRVINSVCGSVRKGNCRGNKQLMDGQLDSNPLPKRRRVQKSKGKLISVQDVKCNYVTGCVSPIVSSQHRPKVTVEPVTASEPLGVSKPAPTSTENNSSKITSNACGMTAKTITRHNPSIIETTYTMPNCNQRDNEYDQSDKAPAADNTDNSSLEERVTEVMRPSDEDQMLVSGYGITVGCQDFWTLNYSEWLNEQVKEFFIVSVC